MLELRDDPLADVLGFLLVLGLVPCNGPEDCYPTPLCAFAERDQEPRESLRVEGEDGFILGRLLDFSEGRDGVRDNLLCSTVCQYSGVTKL